MSLHELPRGVTHPWVFPGQARLTWEFLAYIQPKRYPAGVVSFLTYPRYILLFSGLLGYYICPLVRDLFFRDFYFFQLYYIRYLFFAIEIFFYGIRANPWASKRSGGVNFSESVESLRGVRVGTLGESHIGHAKGGDLGPVVRSHDEDIMCSRGGRM